ncbi:hypothetical protein [Psychrobacter sp. ANT_WB68]|uniref:hypothetical protein n=1 Tax=Psychrobacter sp. ANT_WB68 TaxID=2597355 RepID=UPI0011F16113|nr:hypothetical protein [Psychrobacter sp. ANT_WB68]KAA0915150.1 hypothetical protein FQ084_00875 [Psychrobacter sp. ANT_WB68]
MSQTFNLCLSTDTLAADAQQLGVTIEDLHNIQIEVVATLAQIDQTDQIAQRTEQPEWQLQLDYRVTLLLESLAAQLEWPTWQPTQVGFVDYLWEQTCLECFLAGGAINSTVSINNAHEMGINLADGNKTSPYIEINANPDGRYALYQFKSYRSPATLPPTPLLQADGQTRAFINWTASHCPASNGTANAEQNSLSEQIKPVICSSTLNTAAKTYHYERSFSFLLSQIYNKEDVINDTGIDYIHPCVILSFSTTFGTTALYFAPKHASPPDFHNLEYWSVFDKQAALAK